MAYSTESRVLAVMPGVNSASTGDFAKNLTVLMRMMQPCDLNAVGVLVTTVSDTNDATITVTRRVTAGSDTNAVAVATLTLPTGTAAGKILYKLITPQSCNAGDELKFVFSNNGGSVTWIPWIDATPRSETKANNSDFVASA